MAREKMTTDLYERSNEIIRDAGHEDPESIDPMERFNIVLKHCLKSGPLHKLKEEKEN